MSVKIYHNPRCSKSRETLALLEEKGIQPRRLNFICNNTTLLKHYSNWLIN